MSPLAVGRVYGDRHAAAGFIACHAGHFSAMGAVFQLPIFVVLRLELSRLALSLEMHERQATS